MGASSSSLARTSIRASTSGEARIPEPVNKPLITKDVNNLSREYALILTFFTQYVTIKLEKGEERHYSREL